MCPFTIQENVFIFGGQSPANSKIFCLKIYQQFIYNLLRLKKWQSLKFTRVVRKMNSVSA